jgi:hypothetical protein
MQIQTVSVRYGELRSTGYPSFSNKRYEIELTAKCDPGETGNIVKCRLLEIARREVAMMFDDQKSPANEMHQPIPF